MSHEIIYTSAARGLKPGSRGFCTVASTRNMGKPLAERLESLSGYRHVFPPGDDRNPVTHAHVVLTIARKKYYVLSRIADAGYDYSKRSNKIAHHIALTQNEIVPAGPACLLGQDGFMEQQWSGEPRFFESQRQIPHVAPEAEVCDYWEKASGDAGWAGTLAETVWNTNKDEVYVIYDDGMDILRLLTEAQLLLPVDARWLVTFTTNFTRLPPNVACRWRCVRDGSPEVEKIRRMRHVTLFDLTKPLGPPPNTSAAEAARNGHVLPSPESRVAGDKGKFSESISASSGLSRPPTREPELTLEPLSAPPPRQASAPRAEQPQSTALYENMLWLWGGVGALILWSAIMFTTGYFSRDIALGLRGGPTGTGSDTAATGSGGALEEPQTPSSGPGDDKERERTDTTDSSQEAEQAESTEEVEEKPDQGEESTEPDPEQSKGEKEQPEESPPGFGGDSTDKSNGRQGNGPSTETVNKQTDNEDAHGNGLGENAKRQDLSKVEPGQGSGLASDSKRKLDLNVGHDEGGNGPQISPPVVDRFEDRIYLQLPNSGSPPKEYQIGNTNGVNDLKISGYPVHVNRQRTDKEIRWNVYPEDQNLRTNVPQILIDDESSLVLRYGASDASVKCVDSLKEQGFLIIQWGDEGNENTHVVRFNNREADPLRFIFRDIGKPPPSRDLPCPEPVGAIKIANIGINDPSEAFPSHYETEPTTPCRIHAKSSEPFEIRVECKQKQNTDVWSVGAACYWRDNKIDSDMKTKLYKDKDKLLEKVRPLRAKLEKKLSDQERQEKRELEKKLGNIKPCIDFDQQCGEKKSRVEVKVSLAYDISGELVPLQLPKDCR